MVNKYLWLAPGRVKLAAFLCSQLFVFPYPAENTRSISTKSPPPTVLCVTLCLRGEPVQGAILLIAHSGLRP
jgi:hypothetical protein